jgi:hypothetical protein
VARLTANLEGHDSPIERIISEAPAASRQNGAQAHPAAIADTDGARPPSLAERIRALQTRSGR